MTPRHGRLRRGAPRRRDRPAGSLRCSWSGSSRVVAPVRAHGRSAGRARPDAGAPRAPPAARNRPDSRTPRRDRRPRRPSARDERRGRLHLRGAAGDHGSRPSLRSASRRCWASPPPRSPRGLGAAAGTSRGSPGGSRSRSRRRSPRSGYGSAIGVVPEAQRDYPNGPLAASVIGFTGTDDAGLAGLELRYDALLRGASGVGTANRDAIGRELMQTLQILTPPRDGDTLVLTLDEVIQHIAERELGHAVAQAHALGGVAIVMDPAHRRDPRARDDAVLRSQRVPEGAAGAVEQRGGLGAVRAGVDVQADPRGRGDRERHVHARRSGGGSRPDPHQRRDDSRRGDDRALRVAEPRGHHQVLEQRRRGAGRDPRREGHVRGLHSPVRVRTSDRDRPAGRGVGIIRPISQWFGPTLQNIGFGQGISVTPIQLLVAASSLTTGGMEVRPHLLAEIRDAAGRPVDAPAATPPHRVVPAGRRRPGARDDARGRLGRRDRREGADPRVHRGRQDRDRAEAEPERRIRVGRLHRVVRRRRAGDRPASWRSWWSSTTRRGSYYGGDVAAPVFREIGRQALWYLQIRADGPRGRVRPRARAAVAGGAARPRADVPARYRARPRTCYSGTRAAGSVCCLARCPGRRSAHAGSGPAGGVSRRPGTGEPALVGAPDRDVTGLAYHSAHVRPGDLFAAIRGYAQDGHRYAADAVRRGAAALLVDHALPLAAVQIVVADTRRALAPIAAAFYGDPSAYLWVCGVTGTNGKTTTTHLIEGILARAGGRPGLIGTLGVRLDGVRGRVRVDDVDDAGVARRPASARRDARRGRARRRHGGDLARARAAPRRRVPVRRGRLHQPDAGPPGLPRRSRAVPRGEGAPLRDGRRRTGWPS